MNVNNFAHALGIIAIVMGLSYLFGVVMNWITGFRRR